MKRQLAVRQTHYDYHLHLNACPRPVPFILLKGYWLEQSGFSIGAKVEVSLEKGVLLIKQTE